MKMLGKRPFEKYRQYSKSKKAIRKEEKNELMKEYDKLYKDVRYYK